LTHDGGTTGAAARLTASPLRSTMAPMPEISLDPAATPSADEFLDITHLICPMTFVRTKLAIERMASGSVLEVRLNEGEPLINVPRSAKEMGHKVLATVAEADDESPPVYRLFIAIA
jgi:TusA-related sulfurtransferase